MDKSTQQRLNDLRARAEQCIDEVRRPAQQVISRNEFDRVVHELHVHQVELEMQNDELQRTQTQLLEARDRYFDLYHLAPVGYLTVDRDWRIIESNITAARWLGVDRALLAGKPLSRYLDEAEADGFHRYKDVAAGATDQPARFKGWFRRPDGNRLYLMVATAASEDGEYRCVLVDLTAQRTAEDQLRQKDQRLAESALRFAQVAQQTGDVFYIVTPGHERVVFVSAAFETIFRRPKEEAGGGWLAWVHPDDRPRVDRAVAAAVAGQPYTEEYRICRPDGSWRLLSDRCIPSAQAGEVTGVLQDVTDARQLEEELRRAQRLESIGTLASGIAHDFNNLLMGIAGYAHLALQMLEPTHPAYGFIYRSLGATMRGASLTRQLVSFGDHRGHEPKAMPVDRVIRGAHDLIARLVGDHINVEIDLAAANILVRGDAGEIEQILMNLAGNARDAMPGGGTLTVTTRPQKGGEGGARFVLLAVKDTGCGMSPETLSRIFEPFFTTKEVGRGTGLGLATVFSVVRRLGGDVSVASEVGKGTEFVLRLPVADAVDAGADAWEASPVAGQGQTILVVDDDPLVRATVQSYLQTLGYAVVMCSDADQAIAACQAHAANVDLMLTDIMMPGRLGGDLARLLRESCKDLRVLFMSAHPPADLERLGRIEPGAALLTKPFDMRTLALSVQQLLAAPPTEEQAVACEPEVARKSKPSRRILIVDDDPDVADSLRMFLDFEGQETAVANSGGQAIEAAKSFVPHVVLCDLNLGNGMNGFDVARALREVEVVRGSYVVALTGSDADALRDKASEAGFDLIVTKPIDPSRLDQIISAGA